MDETVDVRKGEELDTAKVEAYLHDVIQGLDGPMTIRQFPSGHSNLTYLITVGGQEMVLRKPPSGTKAKTAHDMSREYRVLKALAPVFPYCPRPMAYCEDSAVMGCSFYVMERLQGVVLRKDIPATMTLGPKDMTRLCQNLIRVLYELHSVDYKKVGLADFGKPVGYVERQVAGWSRRYCSARTPDVPEAQEVMAWLAEKMPPDTDRPCLIHNDFKFDNVVLDPENPLNITGVLDWEMATVGDPLMDLGGSLSYWVEAEDPEDVQMIRMLPTHVKGALKRREVVAYYEELSGRAIKHYDFYRCFGIFKLAVIAQQIYYRYYHGQTQDQRFKMMGLVVGVLERAAMGIIHQSKL